MNSRYKLTLLFILPLVVFGCLKEGSLKADFRPEVFIYGYLTNGTNTLKITIQETVPVDVQTMNPINDASVTLYTEDTSGDTSIVTNSFSISEGVYESTSPVTGIIGHTYWIEVILSNGTSYASFQEQLKPPVPITSITRTSDFTRVNFADPADDVNFYLLEYNFYQNENFVSRIFELSSDNLFNGNPNAFIESEDVVGNRVTASLSNLNYKTYQYYVTAFEQYDNQIDYGEVDSADPFLIFTEPPVNLIGNMKNVTANKTALGFFGVFSFNYLEASF